MDLVRHILVVEDQAAIGEYLVQIIERNGHRGTLAGTGKRSLELLEQQSADIVVLDLGLPDIAGRELLGILKLRWPTMPVIIISSMLDMEERLACFTAGADDFITKPFHPKETIARIERSFLRHGPPVPLKVCCGPLWLNQATGRIVCKGQVVNASRKVFDILYLLASRPGQVFSKQDIACHIWKGFFVSDNSIWVHMNQVRKLLEVQGRECGVVETLPGTGYRYLAAVPESQG